MSDALTRFALAAGGFGLTWLAQSTVLLILGLLAGRAARRRGPALQSAVYRTTLAAVLLCPAASAFLSAMGVEGLAMRLPQAAEEPPQQSLADFLRSDVGEEVVAPAPAPAPVLPPSNEPPPNIVIAPIRYKIPEALAAKLEQINVPTKLTPVESPLRPNPFKIAPIAGVTLWALGSLFLLARMLVQQARMSRVRAKSVAVEPGVQAACATIAGRLGVKPPPMRMSPFLSSPCLDGLIRPMILMPEEMDDDPRDALVHELAHLARRDGWWNLARRLATAALWFQPLAWVLSRRVETTAEEVCDDVAVDLGADRTRYAELLVTIAGRSLPPSSPAAVHMIGRRSPLRRRVTRILDASRPLSTRAGRLAILAVLLIGAASTAFAGLLTIGRGPKPEAPRAVAEEPTSTPKEVAEPALAEGADPTIHGRVTDEQDKPVAGATVVAWRWRRGAVPGVGLREFLPDRRFDSRTATTDADGRYSMPDFEPAPEADDQARFTMLCVTAPGYAISGGGWKSPNPGAKVSGDVKLRIVEGQPIVGRATDSDGRPVAGARVRLRQVYQPMSGQVPRDGPPWHAGGRGAFNGGVVQQTLGLADLKTDAEGRFRIPGLARESVAIIEIDRPDLTPSLVRVLARPMEPREAKDVAPESDLYRLRDLVIAQPNGPGSPTSHASSSRVASEPIYGSDFTTKLAAAQVVEGTVRDAESHQPIAGMAVAISSEESTGWDLVGRFTTTTDDQGRYRFVAPPTYRGAAPWVSVHPKADQPYFIGRPTQPPKAEGGTTTLDFKLRRGRWIVGKLVDDDGRPVAARIDYAPMAANPLAVEYLGPYAGLYNLHGGSHQDRFRTAADGTFRVLGCPGAGVVLARADDVSFLPGVGAAGLDRDSRPPKLLATHLQTDPAAFQVVKAVDVPAADAPFSCDLAASHGDSVLLKFVDEKNEPMKAQVSGRVPPPARGIGYRAPRDGYEEQVRVTGLAPGESRKVGIASPSGPSGLITEVQAGADRVVTLHPYVEVVGRIVHADGKPARGEVNLDVNVNGGSPLGTSVHSTTAYLDEAGRFRQSIPPGGPYQLRALNLTGEGPNTKSHSTQKVPGGFDAFYLTKDLTIEPGKPVDLGTFNADNGQRIEDPKPALQPPQAPAGADPIHGRVIDEQGKPIAGATVVAWRWRRGQGAGVGLREFLPDRRFDSKTTTTDADGRYSMPDFEPAPEWDDQARLTLLSAAAPRYSVGASMWRSLFGPAKAGRDIRLAKGDHPIVGRVLDVRGRPVAGARVRLRLMNLTQVANPVAAGRRSDAAPSDFGRGVVGGPIQKALGLDGLVTDADGRFRYPGMARDAETIFEIDRPGMAPHVIRVFARPMTPVKSSSSTAEGDLEAIPDSLITENGASWTSRGSKPSGERPQELVYGSEFTTTMETGRIIEGVVRDAETQKPIDGVVVAASRARTDGRDLPARITATTDAEGRYRLISPPAYDGGSPWISVHPQADQPYFLPVAATKPSNSPDAPATQDLDLKRGRWIVGKLLDPDGRPVEGSVDYAPMAANPVVAEYFGPQPMGAKFQYGYHQQRFRTAADGSFHVLGIPGPGVVLARAVTPLYLTGVGAEPVAHNPESPRILATSFLTAIHDYHVMKPTDVPEGDFPTSCDLTVDPGGTALLKFVDEKGVPMAAIADGRSSSDLFYGGGVRHLANPPATEARIITIAKGESRQVWIHARSNTLLAATLTVTSGDERTVTLRPPVPVVGRLLRADGRPAAGGVELHLAYKGRVTGAHLPFVTSRLDEEGRFECQAPVGGPYLLRTTRTPGSSPVFDLTKDLTIEPGKPVDLGTFNASTGQRIEDPKPAPQPAPAPAGAGLIHGRVIDEQGKPIAGVSVVAWRWRRGGTAAAGLREFLPDRRFDSRSAKTDSDGRYSMPDFEPAPEWDPPANTTMLCAAAQGFSVETAVWKNPNAGVAAGGDVILRKGDEPITGRVVDAEGRPVAGARVRLRQTDSSVAGRAVDHFDELADGRRKCNGEPIQQALGLAGQTTDADGRFRIPGLRRDTVAIIEIDRPGLAPQLVRVAARVIQPRTIMDVDPESELEEMRDFAPVRRSMAMGASPKSSWAADSPVHGSDFTTTLSPARIVEGVVRDSETQQPIAGVVVAASRRWVDSMDAPARFVTTTDDQGRYRLAAPAADDGEAPWISVHPRADQPYFVPATARSLFAPGVPIKRDFELKRGRWIVGKLLDPDGRPVAAVVDYAPMAANPLARSFEMAPGLTRFQAGYHGDRFRTAADGSFRVLGIPGSGVVLARADDPGYMLAVGGQEIARDAQSQNLLGTSFRTLPRAFHVTKAVEIRDGDAPTSCDLKVSRSGSLLLKFVDEKGEPVEAVVQGRRPSIPLAGINTQRGTDVPATEARVVELADGEGRTIMVSSQAQGGLGVMLTVSPGPDRTVTLLPMIPVSGRVLREDGKPAKGLVLAGPSRNGRLGEILHRLDNVWIDDQGRFEYRLPVGGPYILLVANQTHETRRENGGSRGAAMAKAEGGFAGFYATRDLMVEPGKPVDLGTFNADTGKPAEKKD